MKMKMITSTMANNIRNGNKTLKVSLTLYCCTVAFLACLIFRMQQGESNTQDYVRHTQEELVDRVVLSSRNRDEFIALRALVEDQGRRLAELQKCFDESSNNGDNHNDKSNNKNFEHRSDDQPGQVQQKSTSSLVRPLGGGESDSTSAIVTLTDRLSRLETITKGYMNWITDPYAGNTVVHECKNKKEIEEHFACLDNFPPPPASASSSQNKKCIIYDYGIREQPEFGLHFAKTYPQCEVHAFDPSPKSVNWWNSENIASDELKELRALPNYYFHSWGAGGVDGKIELFGYNWGQVSSVRLPYFVSSLCGYGDNKTHPLNEADTMDPKKYHDNQCLTSTEISHHYDALIHDFSGHNKEENQYNEFERVHHLKVKTLKTTMEELGHTHVDILKMDVEGSEYQFLESAIDDYDCPPVSQMSVEWHHFSFDPRYGGGSSREINSIVTYLHDRCNFKTFQKDDEDGGFCASNLWVKDSGLRLCYTTTSLVAVPPSPTASTAT